MNYRAEKILEQGCSKFESLYPNVFEYMDNKDLLDEALDVTWDRDFTEDYVVDELEMYAMNHLDDEYLPEKVVEEVDQIFKNVT
jgi:hypothetical protein